MLQQGFCFGNLVLERCFLRNGDRNNKPLRTDQAVCRNAKTAGVQSRTTLNNITYTATALHKQKGRLAPTFLFLYSVPRGQSTVIIPIVAKINAKAETAKTIYPITKSNTSYFILRIINMHFRIILSCKGCHYSRVSQFRRQMLRCATR